MKLELVPVPVGDVDRAKDFFVTEQLRFVQLTPPGSACSVVIDDADVARDELRARGVEASEVDDQPWGRFVYFADPYGNTWALQQVQAAG